MNHKTGDTFRTTACRANNILFKNGNKRNREKEAITKALNSNYDIGE